MSFGCCAVHQVLSTAYLFTPKHWVVFEVVVYRRANIDMVIRPLGGRTGAVL